MKKTPQTPVEQPSASKSAREASGEAIIIRGAREHNLKNLDLDIPANQLVVITGLSGSGKSSLAFDTIYAEGQRRYVESLSAYARQFLGEMQKPDVDHIEGLPPAIAIEQRMQNPNPRSTVATTTELYDYLRLLYARCGTPHCPNCHRPVTQQSAEEINQSVLSLPAGTRVMVLAPLVRGQKGEHKDILRRIQREGFVRARIDGEIYDVKSPPPLRKTRMHSIEAVVDRLVIKPNLQARLSESLETALRLSEGLVIITHETSRGRWVDELFSQLYACPDCHISFDEPSPRMFSFNSPYGACPDCDGIGSNLEFDPELIVTDPARTLGGGALAPLKDSTAKLGIRLSDILERFQRATGVAPDTHYDKLPAAQQRILLFGDATFDGIVPILRTHYRKVSRNSLKRRLMNLMTRQTCPTCQGYRLKPQSLAVSIDGKSIGQMTSLTIDQARDQFSGVKFSGNRGRIAEPILRQIRSQLSFLSIVGVGYLTLDRLTQTLSGGEAQRVRLATQVGSGLVGVCYVLDEPTIGLHPRDNERLLGTLKELRDLGNTLLVVEHDEDTILAADHVIDIGPGAGEHGGQIISQGSVEEIINCPRSLTGGFLSGRTPFAVPAKRRKTSRRRMIRLKGAAEHNLKSINVDFPLGVFSCITGVSGSGKSTLINEILLRAMRRKLYASTDRPGRHSTISGTELIDKVIEIDQSPIGRTPRSNAATYTGLFDLIRQVFARTREAKIRGYKPSRFSFNVQGGRCEACQGQGVKKIEMHFLPDIFVVCQQCHGLRYGRETLEIRYRGRSIADVLDMSVAEALSFFENFPKIMTLLTALNDVGLGYIKLGQPSTTLSGGEAQRVKLATELGRAATGNTVYVLDEPTTGLHFADVQRLLDVLNRLVERGNTILVIEHNPEVVAYADWIIDLGPEGGEAGGEVVAVGTPEQISENEKSHTGRYLKRYLQRHAKRRA